jgi:hypothetical protein
LFRMGKLPLEIAARSIHPPILHLLLLQLLQEGLLVDGRPHSRLAAMMTHVRTRCEVRFRAVDQSPRPEIVEQGAG